MNSLQRIELISSKFKSDLKTESNQAPTQPAFTYSKLTIKTLEQRCEICSKLTIKPLKRLIVDHYGRLLKATVKL